LAEGISGSFPFASLGLRTSACPVLFLPIVDWEFRTQRPHHLARSFARAGHRVLYPDLRLGEGRHFEEPEPGILRFQLPGRPELDPYREPLGDDDVARAMVAFEAIDQRLPLAGLWVIATLPAWRRLAIELRRRFSGALLFDCMDSFEHFGDHADLSGEESRLAREADVVTASARSLVAKLEARGAAVTLVPNGCAPDHFLPPLEPPPGPPVIGFFGGIHDWFDGELLAGVARRRGDWTFRLVGDTYRGDVESLRRLPNVEFLGEVPYQRLPATAASFHVGVVPFRIGSLTAATDPVKVYEMLALGLPVVATPLPELERFRPHVRFASDPDAFAAAIAAALEEPFASRAERRSVALGESWFERYLELQRAMNAVPGASRAQPDDHWRDYAALVAERPVLQRRITELERDFEAVRVDRDNLRADRDAARRALEMVTSTRWWRLGERYWAWRKRLRR
jgi:hypothetical protein